MVPFVLGAKQGPFVPTPQEDRYQHICAQPGYDKHSPEEFRVAFLLYGRELTSAELMQMPNPPTAAVAAPPPPPPQPPAPTPAFSALPSAIPQPIFSGATPQSTPKFTFGLR